MRRRRLTDFEKFLRKVILYTLAVLALVLGVFYEYKNMEKAELTVANNDMAPLYNKGDKVKYRLQGQMFGIPDAVNKLEEVVVYEKHLEHVDEQEGVLAVGRVFAHVGDKVEITKDTVTANGKEVALSQPMGDTFVEGVIKVPEGCTIVLPDNNLTLDTLLKNKESMELNCMEKWRLYTIE